ncbi:MAG: TPR end-of-group domain-containing protein, partial [Planctomycetota bacterium]
MLNMHARHLPLQHPGHRKRWGGRASEILALCGLLLVVTQASAAAAVLVSPISFVPPAVSAAVSVQQQDGSVNAQDRRDDEGHPPGRSSDRRGSEISEAQRQQILGLHDRFLGEYEREEWERGLETLREVLSIDPNDTIALYNAACVQIKVGENDKAAVLLEKAVLAGFVNFEHMKRDPDLEPIREHERYKAIEQAISEAYTLSAERMTAWAKERLSSGAIVETDEMHRFVYATEFEQDI